MNRNLRIFFAAEFLKGICVPYAIAVLFYQAIGLNFTHVTVLWLAMAVAQMFLEIPFGLLSDRIGHRKVILLGYAAFACGMTLIGSGANLTLPLVGCAVWGVSQALLSGASDAFLYDVLKDEGKAGLYLKMKGYHSSLSSLGIVVGSVPGSYLFAVNIRYPWYTQAACVVFALIVFSFSRSVPAVEGPVLCGAEGPERRPDQKAGFRRGLAFVLQDRPLLWLTLFSTVCIFPLYGLAVIGEPYLVAHGFQIVHLGYVYASIEILCVMTGLVTHMIEKKLGPSGALLVTVLGFVALFLLLACIPDKWALAPFAVVYGCSRFQQIILNTYSNHRIPSDQRATILSIQAMGGSVLLIVFMLTSGVVLDAFSMNFYLAVLSAYFAGIALPLWFLRKRFHVPAGAGAWAD